MKRHPACLPIKENGDSMTLAPSARSDLMELLESRHLASHTAKCCCCSRASGTNAENRLWDKVMRNIGRTISWARASSTHEARKYTFHNSEDRILRRKPLVWLRTKTIDSAMPMSRVKLVKRIRRVCWRFVACDFTVLSIGLYSINESEHGDAKRIL